MPAVNYWRTHNLARLGGAGDGEWAWKSASWCFP